MNRKTEKYEDAPRDVAEAIGKAVVIRDFLPAPDELVLKTRLKKVTLNLSESSLGFFKQAAKKNHVSYQRMIQELLDRYTEQYR